jgi:hypothetical protein
LTQVSAISSARRRSSGGAIRISATELPNQRVYQRVGATATVSLSGTFTGAASAVSVRVINAATSAEVQAWTQVANPSLSDFTSDFSTEFGAGGSAGSWTGTLSIPQGGWYKLQYRLADQPTAILTATNVIGVGDIWMLAGESQQSRMSTLASAAPTPDDRTVYFNSGTTWDLPGVVAGTGGNGVIRFLNVMRAATTVPQACIQVAVAGTSISDWEVGDPAYVTAASRLQAVGTIAGFLWNQGGTGTGTITRTDYKSRLTALITEIKTQGTIQRVGILPLMPRADAAQTDLAVQETRRAHYEYLGENPTAINLGWAPSVPLSDDTLQTAPGSEELAYRYAHALLYAMGTETVQPLGPTITAASRSGTTITLTVQHKSGGSLKINSGTQATGFQIFPRNATHTDASALAISSIALAASTITITLASDPGQALDIYYQYGRFDATSPIFDNTTFSGVTTGNALQPLMAPVQTAVEAGTFTRPALQFDGTTGYARYPYSGALNWPDADWTTGVWVRIDNPAGAGSQFVISTGSYTTANTFNFIIYETSHSTKPSVAELSLRGTGATSIQITGDTTPVLTHTGWRLWIFERIKATETLNIYYAPPNGTRTLYKSGSVSGLGAIIPNLTTGGSPAALATRAPPASASAQWMVGSLWNVWNLRALLTSAEMTQLAAGADIITGLGKNPNLHTKLNTLTSPIANSGTDAANATLTGGIALTEGPAFLAGGTVVVPVPAEVSVPTADSNSWYVSTTGNDTTGTGTEASPYLTVSKGIQQAAAHATRKTVILRGGTYRFSSHIYLDSTCANLIIAGYPGETAIISGGELLTGFASEGGGLYSKATTATSLDLFIGEVRQRCAQSGNIDPSSPFGTGWLLADAASTPSTTAFRYRAGEVPSGLMQTGLMVQVPGGYPVGGSTVGSANVLKPVSAINDTTRTITISGSAPENIATNAIFRLINHPSLIKNDGEFAWRQSDGKLVVRPKSSGFESLGVVVPRAATPRTTARHSICTARPV